MHKAGTPDGRGSRFLLFIRIFSMAKSYPRRIQRRPDGADDQGQPGQVARAGAKDLLDQAEGGVAVRAAQEHEIGAAQVVDQGGGQQVQAKDGAYLGQAADVDRLSL